MDRMTPDTTGTVQGTGQGAPVAPDALLDPEAPNTPAIVHRPQDESKHRNRIWSALPGLPQGTGRRRTGASVRPTSAPAPDTSAPTQGNPSPDQGNGSAPASAPRGAGIFRRALHRATPKVAPVQAAAPVVPAPRPAGRTAPPPRRRQGKGSAPSLSEQWGKLTIDQGPWARFGMKVLAGLIAIALVGVVIAPPVLSAHDILAWARNNDTGSGLGLTKGWSWVAFGALDLAAAVCVLISLYCAIRNWKAGFFAFGVWVFAGATAFANYQFGSRPGAPGDAIWFFPAMSVLGPILLHATLKFVRKVVRHNAGGERPSRPTFPWTDWNPLTGSPQDTWGAWKTGGLLGIEKADDAMWAYRVVSLDAGWVRRWFVKHLVRRHQMEAMRARLNDETLALVIPGLLPDNAFVALDDPGDALPDVAPPAPVAPAAPAALPTRTPSGALTGALPRPAAAPAAPGHTDTVRTDPAALTAPAAPIAPAGSATAASGAPAGQSDPAGQGAPQGAPQGAEVVDLAESAYASYRSALLEVFEAYGSKYSSWAQLTAPSTSGGIALNKIEKELGIGKRRIGNAFRVAENVLPWADAPDAVRQRHGRPAGEATG